MWVIADSGEAVNLEYVAIFEIKEVDGAFPRRWRIVAVLESGRTFPISTWSERSDAKAAIRQILTAED